MTDKAVGGEGRNPFYENQFDDEPDEWFAMRKELLNALEAWETGSGNMSNKAIGFTSGRISKPAVTYTVEITHGPGGFSFDVNDSDETIDGRRRVALDLQRAAGLLNNWCDENKESDALAPDASGGGGEGVMDLYTEILTTRALIPCPHKWPHRVDCRICEVDDNQVAIEGLLWRIAELTTEIARLRSEMAGAAKLLACALEE